MDRDTAAHWGLDVGKGEHHAIGLDPAGKQRHNAPLPNSEVFDKLAKHGRILVVVDQPATIGALPVTVARTLRHTLRRVDVGDDTLADIPRAA